MGRGGVAIGWSVAAILSLSVGCSDGPPGMADGIAGANSTGGGPSAGGSVGDVDVTGAGGHPSGSGGFYASPPDDSDLGGADGAPDGGGSGLVASGGDGTGAGVGAGSSGNVAPSSGCPNNHICAQVSLPDTFEGEVQRVAVVLFDEASAVGQTCPQEPAAYYPALVGVELTATTAYALTQDFTAPVEGDYSGERYIGIVVFLSTEDHNGVPGVDYWYVTPETYAIGSGDSFDLGPVTVERIPVTDDPNTGGNEGVGVVFCIDRLHEDAGPTEFSCDVGQGGSCCLMAEQEGTCGTDTCTGGLVHDCDGPEDCSFGEICCGEPWEDHQCATAEACGKKEACHDANDCTDQGAACVIATDGMADIAYCVGAEPSTPGDERPGQVACGASLACDDLCCVNAISPPYECGIGSCPGDEVQATYECDGPEDCADGELCCATTMGDQTCQTECNVAAKCHVDEDCPAGSVCSTGGSCD